MSRDNFLIIIIVCFTITLTGCIRKNSLTILADRPEYHEKSENSIIASLEKALANIKIDLKTKIDPTNRERLVLDKINSGEGDIAIVKNSIKIDDSYSNIRTIMPLFPEVFLTLYKETATPPRFDSLISKGKVVFIANKKKNSLSFTSSLTC